ncbi:ABC transporter ATP-binding protein [Verrucomicrobium spinosum]|uniref:ABC transporter ATP-binding protein n=1 Tax=Verrucomicrobium spinosum TaxID=2736 RepID=UPI0001745EAF|nr:ABC transporter ATP-binding protein [Verrucomicrobium spinosum]
MIEANGLTKRFTAGRLALDDVSFSVKDGEITGLLGHNGAGKSTVLGIMLGMVRPDAGEVTLAGHSVQKERSRALRHVGAIFEAPSFYEYMSGWQNLRSLCALSGWWEEKEVVRVLQLVNLHERVHHKVRTYSHGMRQRLALAQALLPMPKILLLDEPTDGLDPEGIHEFRSTVLALRKEHGLTILLNSHLLAEVELMCDRCVILKAGHKVYDGALGRREETAREYLLDTPDTERARYIVQRCGAVWKEKGLVELPGQMGGPALLEQLVLDGVKVQAWTPHRKTLEDWYLELSANPNTAA